MEWTSMEWTSIEWNPNGDPPILHDSIPHGWELRVVVVVVAGGVGVVNARWLGTYNFGSYFYRHITLHTSTATTSYYY